MSDLVIFDKLGFNQQFDAIPEDKQFEFGLSALRATPTILAGLIATSHPCDVEAVLKKPLEILVLLELYYNIPGLAKKVFENTLHCLDGTIPAQVEILSGGANELVAVDEEQRELAEIRKAERAAALASAIARRKAAESAGAIMDARKNAWSKSTKEEVKAVVLATITSAATCALVYGLTAVAVSVAAGVTAGSAGAAVGATEFVALVAKDKAGAVASSAVAGAGAVAEAATGAARSAANTVLSAFGAQPVATPSATPTPMATPPPITVADRASEAMYSAETVTVMGSQMIVNAANTVIFSGVSDRAMYIGSAGFFVILAIVYYFMWRSLGRKIETSSLDETIKLVNAVMGLSSPPLQTLMPAPAQQVIANAPAPVAAPPPTQQMITDEGFETPKAVGGVTRHRTSLPTRRGRRSSSSSKRRYTHRRPTLLTGKGGYLPTKSGRKA